MMLSFQPFAFCTYVRLSHLWSFVCTYVCMLCPFSICLFGLSVHCCIYVRNKRYTICPSLALLLWRLSHLHHVMAELLTGSQLNYRWSSNARRTHSTAVSRRRQFVICRRKQQRSRDNSTRMCVRVLAMVHAESLCAIESYEIRALIVAESDIREASS